MKEPNAMRQTYATSRNLDCVLEENDSMSQTGIGYRDQVLDPAISSSLSFFRAAHAKTSATMMHATYYQAPMSATGGGDDGLGGQHQSTLQIRRGRAGTMPSSIFALPGDMSPKSTLLRPPVSAATTTTVAEQVRSDSSRHRSGSLNLVAPPPFLTIFGASSSSSSFSSPTWANDSASQIRSSLPSPGTEQLLRGDNDMSIACTMRSIGLEEEGDMVTAHQPLQSPSSNQPGAARGQSLLPGSRTRSRTVNATMFQDTTPQFSPVRARSNTISRAFEITRPRASSMGRTGQLTRPINYGMPSALWQMQRLDDDNENDTNDDAEFDPTQVSLGDSELLENLMQSSSPQQQRQHRPQHEQPCKEMAEPYVHYSQSTPILKAPQIQVTTSTSSPSHAPTRSLWIGNIDASIFSEDLRQLFTPFGSIESVRLLPEKECAFVNYFHVQDAVRAKEEVMGKLGGRVGNCIIRIGFGRAEASIPDTTALQPTRALWLGNIPMGIAPSTLHHMFSSFGEIESVRVLSNKNCCFINFDSIETASRARDALLQKTFAASKDLVGVRIGFAKVPPPASKSNSNSGLDNKSNIATIASSSSSSIVTATMATSMAIPAVIPSNTTSTVSTGKGYIYSNNDGANPSDSNSWLSDLWNIMKELGADEEAYGLIRMLETSSSYFESIPPVPEFGTQRKFDAAKLRDLRKRLDSAAQKGDDAEAVATECMDEIAELCSDYIGNTVVQRLFEKCTEETKTAMLKKIAPHLAAIGVHKNGTWAAQKIIDTMKSPEQVQLVCTHIKPYVPSLLLDQFGNYVVQCCLKMESDDDKQFIFNAMVERLLSVGQGRFGSRAMRGILESQNITLKQQIFVAAALIQRAIPLSMNANGALLLSWIVESSKVEKRHTVLAHRLLPQLSQLATHKLGSQLIYKIFSQDHEPAARESILDALENEKTLHNILSDQTRGVVLIQKIISSSRISPLAREHLCAKTRIMLSEQQGDAQKKFLEELSTKEEKHEY